MRSIALGEEKDMKKYIMLKGSRSCWKKRLFLPVFDHIELAQGENGAIIAKKVIAPDLLTTLDRAHRIITNKESVIFQEKTAYFPYSWYKSLPKERWLLEQKFLLNPTFIFVKNHGLENDDVKYYKLNEKGELELL